MTTQQTETMPDPLDRAAQLEQISTESSINAVRKLCAPKQKQRADGTYPITECVECGEEIGHARLVATGSDLCIYCATEAEKRKGKR